MEHLRLKVLGLGHVTDFEILDPLYLFGVVEDSDFIFGTHIEHSNYSFTPVSEMNYTVSSGTLNSSISYHTISQFSELVHHNVSVICHSV